MGAKTSMLVIVDGSDAKAKLTIKPQLDREASERLAAHMFPDEKFAPLDDGNLSDTNPPDDELLVGCFPGVSIIAASEFSMDYPSKFPERFTRVIGSRSATLHTMHSVQAGSPTLCGRRVGWSVR